MILRRIYDNSPPKEDEEKLRSIIRFAWWPIKAQPKAWVWLEPVKMYQEWNGKKWKTKSDSIYRLA